MPARNTESGTATIGPASGNGFVNGFELGTITTIDAFFTIDSPAGQVTGTKHLSVTGTGQSACYEVQNRRLPDGTLFTGVFRRLCSCGATFLVSYDATIKTADGTFGDSGGSDLLLDNSRGLSAQAPSRRPGRSTRPFAPTRPTLFPWRPPDRSPAAGRPGARCSG